MRRLLLFLLMNVGLCGINAQTRDISGHYFDETGIYEIEIKDSTFSYIIYQNPMIRMWENDTLAKCTFSWVDDNFIKINSKPNLDEICREVTITQATDSMLSDSVKVIFQMPYDREGLHIWLTRKGSGFTTEEDNYSRHVLDYSQSNNYFLLSGDTKSFSFFIDKDNIYPHGLDGRFYGLLSFSSYYDIKTADGANLIMITIPALDNSFFERYYVVDEYVLVKDNSINWKGDTYFKDTRKRRRK